MFRQQQQQAGGGCSGGASQPMQSGGADCPRSSGSLLSGTTSGASSPLFASASSGSSSFSLFGTAAASSSASVGAGAVNVNQAYKHRILNIYQQHDPSKLGRIDSLMARNVGQEHTLYLKVCKKYNVQAMPEIQVVDIASAALAGIGRASGGLFGGSGAGLGSSSFGAASGSSSGASPFGSNSSSSLGGSLFGASSGSISGISLFGTSSSGSSAFGASGSSSGASLFGTSSSSTSSSINFWGGVTGPPVALPSPAPATTATDVKNAYRERILKIYQQHNPSKVDKIDTQMENCMGQEHAMYIKICNKYNVRPEPEIKVDASACSGLFGSTSPPGSSCCSSSGSGLFGVLSGPGSSQQREPANLFDGLPAGVRPAGAGLFEQSQGVAMGTVFQMQEITDGETKLRYAHIGAMHCYKHKSFEELRMEDYKDNRLQGGPGLVAALQSPCKAPVARKRVVASRKDQSLNANAGDGSCGGQGIFTATELLPATFAGGFSSELCLGQSCASASSGGLLDATSAGVLLAESAADSASFASTEPSSRASLLTSHEFWGSEKGECRIFIHKSCGLAYEELVGDGSQKIHGSLKETLQHDTLFDTEATEETVSQHSNSTTNQGQLVATWHADLLLSPADSHQLERQLDCQEEPVGEIVVQLRIHEHWPAQCSCIRTRIKPAGEDEWDLPVLCKPIPCESFFDALRDGDYDAIHATASSGVYLTPEQRSRISCLRELSEAVASDNISAICVILSGGLQLCDAERQRVQQLCLCKALEQDDLRIIDDLLEVGVEPSKVQSEQIKALRDKFTGEVPSLFAIHQRFLAVVSQRRLEYQPPSEFLRLIDSLQECLLEGSLLQTKGALSAAALETVITDVACMVKRTQDSLVQAQVGIRKSPHDDNMQRTRDECRTHHASCLLMGCAKLLRSVGVIPEDDDVDEPVFSSDVASSRLKVQEKIKSLQIAAASLGESIPACDAQDPGGELHNEEQTLIQTALQCYERWMRHCTGADVVPVTDKAAEAARVALSRGALFLGCGQEQTLQMAQSLKDLSFAIAKEEAVWASRSHERFPPGDVLVAAGQSKHNGIKQYIDALVRVDGTLAAYAADLSEAEQGMSPEKNRNNLVQSFETAVMARMEAHEGHEDALLVLQRAKKRNQDNEQMRADTRKTLELLRTADSELRDATAAIASISHIFPEVSSHFKEGLPVDLLRLWVPDRTLSVFSQLELLPGSSRNPVYKAVAEECAFAIKEFKVTPSSLGSCYREAAILQRMRHPHIVELTAIFEDPASSALYLQFPFYAHGQLDGWVQREHPGVVPLRRAIWQIVQALKHLHAHDIVHSDVKPANILIDNRACAHLADFDVSVDSGARTSVARATQVGFSAGFAAPELVSSGASSATDMFALGQVINVVAERNTEREEIVAELKAVDPDVRPSASSVLQHQYFNPVVDWSRDSVRQCCVMAGKLCEFGAADCRRSQGIECANGHFVCLDCFDVHVKHTVSQHGFQHRMQEGRVHCPKYPSECQSCAFDDAELASRVEPATFEAYFAARTSLLERRRAQELEEEMKCRLACELEHLASLDESRRKVLQARNHITEQILTLKCPRCTQAFIDFEGCFALKCSRCAHGFCAWCGEGSPSDDAHEHVRQCKQKPPGADIFFGTPDQFKQAQIKRQRRLLKDYLATLEEDISNIVLVELRHELKDLSDDFSPSG